MVHPKPYIIAIQTKIPRIGTNGTKGVLNSRFKSGSVFLNTITEKLHKELHNDSSLSFIRQALPILLQRNNDNTTTNNNNNNNNNNDNDDDNIGTLISLHSGHNGWPHYHDIKNLENLIKEKLSLKV